jgi:hypothetical protein
MGMMKVSELRSSMNSERVDALKGHDFTGCGKTHSGGRPGIYPRHKANKISGGFSH